jgi:hypothetical protein
LLCFEYTHRTLPPPSSPKVFCFWYILRFNESLSMVTIRYVQDKKGLRQCLSIYVFR